MKDMKLAFILMLLSFKLFAQIDFPQDIIAREGIIKVSKCLVIPKTNPDYYKKPVGLILKSETVFDSKGHVISLFSPNGAVASHSKSKDIRQYYFYKDGRIDRMSKIDFDSISVKYLYFDKKNLTFKIKSSDKNGRIGLELVYNNSINGREVKKIEIDFRNTSMLNNSCYLYKTSIIYSKEEKKIKTSRKLVSISKEQLNAFKFSNDIKEVENNLNEVESGIFLDDINFEILFVYNKKEQLIKEVSEDSTIEYLYDEKGLLVSSNTTSNKYKFVSKFVYSKSN